MTDGNIVEFETVHRRFGEAVEALSQLSELMGELRETEKERERSTAAMSDVSDRLREMSATLVAYCDLLRSALEATLEALQSAESLVNGAELAAIRTEVVANKAALTHLVGKEATLEVKLADFANRQSTIADAVGILCDKIDRDLHNAEQSRDAALSELAEAKEQLGNLETRLKNVPARIRRKYDL